MRLIIVLLIVLASGAATAQPIRVTIECEDYGRTKACPAFLLGFVDELEVLLQSPRASADVVVYTSAVEVALVDRIHLRFVSTLSGAPAVIEIDVDVDSRADDDTQRAQLKPAFERGIALFVATRFPKVVKVEIGKPEEGESEPKDTSPWDFALELGGFANRTGPYQNYNGWSSLGVNRLEKRSRAGVELWGNGGINRQPPLVLDDGTEVSVDSTNWSFGAGIEGAWLYNHCYSVGGASSVWRGDPKGHQRYGTETRVGVEWDRFPADDPRGNRLAVAYVIGHRVERYNIRNELGERFVHFPIHALIASARVRKDKISLGLFLSAGAQLLAPARRHHVSASPSIELQLGDHVDLSASFSITKRELPGPDETMIDPMDYALLSRLSYAEPLSMNASFHVKIHWDRTNGARNDRFDDI
jgi:hypothetical protein